MIEVKVKTLDHFDPEFELPFYATEGPQGRISVPASQKKNP
jgi:hypothetical protein